ncbi:DUF4405 domain-containing protein [bacterium]|nr:DUF4405 domain-containing protein [bacterium]
MRRPALNFIIDSLGFVGFVLLTATGVLMRYVLPPGSGRFTTIWTLDRHEWGSIHFWIAIAFLAILAFHLFLHWRWIVAVLRGRPREGSGARVALGAVGLVALLALAIAPFLSPVERIGGAPRDSTSHSSGAERWESIRGSMTLAEVEEATGVPADHIIEELELPAGVREDDRLGRLKAAYGFEIDDVRRIVAAYRGGEAHGPRR